MKNNRIDKHNIITTVLGRIAPGKYAFNFDRSMYTLDGRIIHTRFCSGGRYGVMFSLNPASLRADYELWICGHPDYYYLIPQEIIRSMYTHPRAYRDRHNPNARIVRVFEYENIVCYAKMGVKMDIEEFFCATLPED